MESQPVCVYRINRTGKIEEIRPTIHPGFYYGYRRDYQGLFPAGATFNYTPFIERLKRLDLEEGMITILQGKLPEAKG